MISNRDIAQLRRIILDDNASASRRLSSIDLLAAQSNAWQTKKVHTDSTCDTPKRMKDFLRKGLRKLLKNDKFKAPCHNSAIRARILCLKGISLGSGLWRNATGAPTAKPPAPSAVLSGIAATLAAYEQQRQENNQ